MSYKEEYEKAREMGVDVVTLNVDWEVVAEELHAKLVKEQENTAQLAKELELTPLSKQDLNQELIRIMSAAVKSMGYMMNVIMTRTDQYRLFYGDLVMDRQSQSDLEHMLRFLKRSQG